MQVYKEIRLKWGFRAWRLLRLSQLSTGHRSWATPAATRDLQPTSPPTAIPKKTASHWRLTQMTSENDACVWMNCRTWMPTPHMLDQWTRCYFSEPPPQNNWVILKGPGPLSPPFRPSSRIV